MAGSCLCVSFYFLRFFQVAKAEAIAPRPATLNAVPAVIPVFPMVLWLDLPAVSLNVTPEPVLLLEGLLVELPFVGSSFSSSFPATGVHLAYKVMSSFTGVAKS